MGEYLALDERQRKVVEEFTKALAKSQAVTFVAIVKDGDAPAQYRTGGYKGPGPTIVDMGRSLGVACAELAQAIIEAAKSNGQPIEWDDAINAVFESVADGAESFRAAGNIKSGTRTIQEKDDDKPKGPTGIAGAPRGF